MGYLNNRDLREAYDREIDSFTFFDDFFMSIAFDNNFDLVAYVLQIILKKKDIVIVSSITQKQESNLYGRSARYDVLAADSQGCLYHMEIENDRARADEMRASYYSAVLVYKNTDRGKKKVEYTENYTIFFTDADYYREGEPLYPVDRYYGQNKRPFYDKTHILYVNDIRVKRSIFTICLHNRE